MNAALPLTLLALVMSEMTCAVALPKVFGAGLSGTGTQAVAEALRRIGYRKVIHNDHTFAPYMHGGVTSDGTNYTFTGLGACGWLVSVAVALRVAIDFRK